MLVHYANRTILLVVMFVVCALSALGRADNDVRLSGVTIRSLAIDPQDAKTLYAATPMSIYKSRDGGASWSESSVPSPMFINGLQVNLKDSNTIYAAAYNDYDDGVFKSVDGGLSWTKLLNVVGAWALAIDPQDSNTLYVGAGYGDIGSTPGVFSTHDGGLSWKRIAEFNVYTLLIDPQNSQIVYAGGPRALMRTSDGGNTWSSVGIDASEFVYALVIDSRNSNVLYAGTGTGIFKTTDAGQNWTNLTFNRGTMYVSKLVIDGNDPDILYAASLGPYFFHAPRIPDLLKTTDAGATWTAVPKLGMVDVWSLTIDPLNTHTVYAGTSSGVWKTEDGGITWSANLILTLSTPSHCTGSAWELGVSNALANAPIRLAGTSNGKEWAIENWGITDSGGTFAASGIFTEETLGVQSLHVEVGDARSNSVTIGIDNCKD